MSRLVKYNHFGTTTLIDPKPITLAKIGDEIEKSILIHPRYVPKGLDHELISIRGRIRGRSIYVLLDEPLISDIGNHTILNFKGTGANYRGKFLVIDLKTTCKMGKRVKRVNSKRPWGGLLTNYALTEIEDSLISILPFVNHLRINEFPEKLNTAISEGKTSEALSQLIRCTPNTFRLNELHLLGEEFCFKEINPNELARKDAFILKYYFSNLQHSNQLDCIGLFGDNRYQNGDLTDSENFSFIKINFETLGLLPCILIHQNLLYLPQPLLGPYVTELAKQIPFFSDWAESFTKIELPKIRLAFGEKKRRAKWCADLYYEMTSASFGVLTNSKDCRILKN